MSNYVDIFHLYGATMGATISPFEGVALAPRIMGAAAMANPLVLIIAAIIAAIVLCIIYWDEIKAACIAAWEGMKEPWGTAVKWFEGIIESTKAKFQKFKDFIKDLLPPWLKDLLGIDGGKGITATITETKKALTDMASSFIPEGVANTFAEIGDAIKGLGGGATTMAAASSPELAISPSSISHTKSSNTSVTTNMGGVNIEVKSTDPVQAGAEVKNGLQAMVNTNNAGVKQK